MSDKAVHPVVVQLRGIRRMRDITQSELAERTGYHRETFSQWEKGHRTPNLRQLQDWLDALDCDIEVKGRKKA